MFPWKIGHKTSARTHSCGKLQKLWLKDSVLTSATLTKVTAEDEEWRDVDEQTQELGNDHQVVPRADGQCNHQQLGQDQRRERNRHNVDEVVLKQQQRAEH